MLVATRWSHHAGKRHLRERGCRRRRRHSRIPFVPPIILRRRVRPSLGYGATCSRLVRGRIGIVQPRPLVTGGSPQISHCYVVLRQLPRHTPCRFGTNTTAWRRDTTVRNDVQQRSSTCDLLVLWHRTWILSGGERKRLPTAVLDLQPPVPPTGPLRLRQRPPAGLVAVTREVRLPAVGMHQPVPLFVLVHDISVPGGHR
jgi:hypothetical protein